MDGATGVGSNDDPELQRLQEELDKQLEEWNAIAQKRLSIAREARKRAEADAQLLANRIALLKDEDNKAWKKIDEARRKKDEIIESRHKRESDIQLQEAARRGRQEEEADRRRRNEELRALNQAKRAEAREALKAAKSSAAQQKKLETAANQRFLDQKCLDEAEQRRQNVSKVRNRISPRSARSESPSSRSRCAQIDYAAHQRLRGNSQSPELSLENEERDLIRRLRFSAAAARPPRPEIENAPHCQDARTREQRASCRERVRCAALASARGRFEAEPPLKLLDLNSATASSDATV